ncbi:ROK family protein [Lacticaseibacillus jixiensis]|uniref:ROK family protein n=1 Tax=Lacticaseibacillus jixiensis TaxID=3231926 RepID=UPI0036F2F0BD
MVEAASSREDIHEQNKKRVLSLIYSHQPISRVEISRQLGVNKSTITVLFNELMADGLVEELGVGESTSVGGRKPVLVSMKADHGYFINFDLGYNHLHVMATDFNGKVLFFHRLSNHGQNIHRLLAIMDNELAQAAQDMRGGMDLLGIGFSIHGVVDGNKITYSPFIDMEEVDLYDYFTNRYHVFVTLENEANLAAIYERDFNGGRGKSNILVVSVHKGIGSGIILNGQLYKGAGSKAGEIGRSILYTSEDDEQVPGLKVEDFCSEDAVIERICRVKQLSRLDREGVAKYYAQSDSDVVAILTTFSRKIAEIVFNVAATLAPEEIYLNSPLMERIPDLYTQVCQFAEQLSVQQPLKQTDNAQYATLLGCFSKILHVTLDMESYDIHLDKRELPSTLG